MKDDYKTNSCDICWRILEPSDENRLDGRILCDECAYPDEGEDNE